MNWIIPVDQVFDARKFETCPGHRWDASAPRKSHERREWDRIIAHQVPSSGSRRTQCQRGIPTFARHSMSMDAAYRRMIQNTRPFGDHRRSMTQRTVVNTYGKGSQCWCSIIVNHTSSRRGRAESSTDLSHSRGAVGFPPAREWEHPHRYMNKRRV
jgi:hypothetical protein